MDSYNLKTASGYINNLLLARGLLRDGKPIEFAHPSKGEGGKEATMAQIINVVHDLILRRDRDQDQRESLIQTIRTLRNESTQTNQKLERLQTKNEDLARQVSLGQSQERSAKLALRTAESSARALGEEMARLKITVQQVRTSCANDIRKRDVQIQRLKSHLTAQQRGNKTGLVGASITITPGATGMSGATARKEYNHPTVDDPDYSLKQETTEFLTQLSQSLSDENDDLIGLVRSTLSTLRHLQGLPESAQLVGEDMATGHDERTEGDMLQALPTSYDALASDMDAVLESLRNLLTNPNFVSIEEVEIREQQILRLRMGWEKMELKWREAVLLMDGWRKRLLQGGETVNLDELKMGLGLGVGLQTVNGGNDISIISEDEEEEEEVMDEDELEKMEQELDAQESSFEEVDEAPVLSKPEKTNSNDLFNIKLPKLPREQPPLQETDGNMKSPRKVNFVPSVQTSARASPIPERNENSSEIDLVRNDDTKTSQLSPTRQKLERSRNKPHESRIPCQVGSINDRDPPSRKRTPSPHAEQRSPKLSVRDKLYQAEAEAARIADGLTASGRVTTAKPAKQRNEDESKDISNDDKLERARSRIAARKTRMGGRPRKRKSTLTPEELEGLMFAS